MIFLIVGCGRVGVQLAQSLSAGNEVIVIDTRAEAFDPLGPSFPGRTVQGEGTDLSVLIRAGVERADGLAAVTTFDNANAVIAKLARDRFHVPRVVARLYDPHRLAIYQHLGLPTVASSTWAASKMEQALLPSQMRTLAAIGDGSVQLTELDVPQAWGGRTIAEIIGDKAVPAAVVRKGRATLAGRTDQVQAGDKLILSSTPEQMVNIQSQLAAASGP